MFTTSIIAIQTGGFAPGFTFNVESTDPPDSHLPARALQWQAGASVLRAGVLLIRDAGENNIWTPGFFTYSYQTVARF
jgi:hypothetical protein